VNKKQVDGGSGDAVAGETLYKASPGSWADNTIIFENNRLILIILNLVTTVGA
jgi:hypothetical protein